MIGLCLTSLRPCSSLLPCQAYPSLFLYGCIWFVSVSRGKQRPVQYPTPLFTTRRYQINLLLFAPFPLSSISTLNYHCLSSLALIPFAVHAQPSYSQLPGFFFAPPQPNLAPSAHTHTQPNGLKPLLVHRIPGSFFSCISCQALGGGLIDIRFSF